MWRLVAGSVAAHLDAGQRRVERGEAPQRHDLVAHGAGGVLRRAAAVLLAAHTMTVRAVVRRRDLRVEPPDQDLKKETRKSTQTREKLAH